MATFESMDRRMPKIEACLKANGLESLDACNEMLLAKGIDCDKIVRGVQPICFDNAVWAYTLGTAIAVKRGLTDAERRALIALAHDGSGEFTYAQIRKKLDLSPSARFIGLRCGEDDRESEEKKKKQQDRQTIRRRDKKGRNCSLHGVQGKTP